ncbi:hypothetical protein SAMN02799624_01020 [Paenibacillus sp. UNC496MF]|uniref:hypothetical protein n=1 Tax=Paenibacillus sp. UNC496MF TaxID=1502753 RepID=UPI0008EAF460|nr:hypothetical protein [Paenibacillus sp. UNC496MF]SFI49114.1 hypothetical protein SAMN02799624_01020 [Paenibacillus sp. UNC496MF]
MGLIKRIKGWLASESGAGGRGEPSFEAYTEAAGEKLREFAVAIGKLESGLLSAKERLRGLERQADGFRAAAEQAAARGDERAARAGLEREYERRRQAASQEAAVRGMADDVARTKARYAAFKQAVDEAGAKHDKLRLRALAASSEWEAGRAASAEGQEERLRGLSDDALAAEALAELRQGERGDAIDEEIAKLLRERKPGP